MNTSNRLLVFVCAFVLAFSLVGCGSSSTATSQSSKANTTQSSTQSKSAKESDNKQEESKGSGESPIDQKFLGHWVGYDSYTTDGVNVTDAMLLSDANTSATLYVGSDGNVQVVFTTNGQPSKFLFRMEKGQSGNGYALYDESDVLRCTLEYGGQNGPVSWLVLATPNSDGTMLCFTFSQGDSDEKTYRDSDEKTYRDSGKKTYSDIPTAYPNMYWFDPDSGLRNIYDESKVIGWEEAANHVGETVTVEGDVDSVVYAASTSGAPYFFNIGGGAYEGFAVVIWSEDLSKFDDHKLRNDVEWSMSDQPLQIRLRVSGLVEMYNGRPQITARDGTQVAEWVNGGWYSLISDSSMDALMRSLYE